MKVDYLIIGSGLTGSVIARTLADAGQEVMIVERRSHLGGNVHDHGHPSGICVHTYGPHYFRTNSDKIWKFVRRFAEFHKYEACIKTSVNGRLENWPIAASYIATHIGSDWKPHFQGIPKNFEQAALALMPPQVYESFVKEYTEKQWGTAADALSADLCKRFDVRQNDEPRLTPRCRHQGIPVRGYANMLSRMVEGIPVVLNFDYSPERRVMQARRMTVFTGPIDEFFGFDIGRLRYRGQQREHRYLADVDFAQPCGQVNHPMHADGPHIRVLEWKHMMPSELARRIRGTVLTTETPYTPDEPSAYEYPFPDRSNALLYERYRMRADALAGVLICGRLGEYRYYDMDQAIARALVLARRLLEKKSQSALA